MTFALVKSCYWLYCK